MNHKKPYHISKTPMKKILYLKLKEKRVSKIILSNTIYLSS